MLTRQEEEISLESSLVEYEMIERQGPYVNGFVL